MRTTTGILVLLALLLARDPASPAPGTTLTFLRHGREVRMLTLEEMEALAPPVTLTLFEPHVGTDRAYRALPLPELLDAVYGAGWRAGGDLLFLCADGYEPTVPVQRFRETPALLAVGTGDGSPFRLTHARPPHKTVDLGPFYLVWDNRERPESRTDVNYAWPYQVVAVDLIDFASRYPKAAPPPGSSEEVLRGFQAFREYCMVCHRVNGQGGTQGPELNSPVSVTEYLREGWLERWILEPASIRDGTKMPGLASDLPDRDRVAREIVAYLKAKARD